MRMRLAHKCRTPHKRRRTAKKKMKNNQNGKPNEWSISWCFTIILWFLWTGYYVIGIYSFFFSCFTPSLYLSPSHHCLCSWCGFCLGTLSYCWALQIVYALEFPRQFIIDIMLSYFFFLCVCVCMFVGYVCRRAHVQEMWDRLCFYCVAWPFQLTEFGYIAPACPRIIHSAHFLIDYSFITFHQNCRCCSIGETKRHCSLCHQRSSELLYSHLNLLPSFLLIHVVFILFPCRCESMKKYVNDFDLPSHVNWP